MLIVKLYCQKANRAHLDSIKMNLLVIILGLSKKKVGNLPRAKGVLGLGS
jgi:hypothetical protein